MKKLNRIKQFFTKSRRSSTEEDQPSAASATGSVPEPSRAEDLSHQEISTQTSTSQGQPGTSAEQPELWSTCGEYGIKMFADASDQHIVDVVFVHGFTGNRETTWKARGRNPWPQELLPSKLPEARIISFGYDAGVAGLQRTSQNDFADHARNLVNQLEDFRFDTHTLNKPIIFVTHSLGGLVTERALLISKNGRENDGGNILRCTRGVVFMGTPLKGSSQAAWAAKTGKIINNFSNTNIRILSILKVDSTELQGVQEDFTAMRDDLFQRGHDIKIRCYYEELEMQYFGVGKVVEKSSATFSDRHPAVGIRADHSTMTKFSDPKDVGFISVVTTLRRWIQTLQQRESSSAAVSSMAHSDAPLGLISAIESIHGADSITRPHDEETERRCVLSLTFDQIDTRENNIDAAHLGTCNWLSKTEEYQKWIQGRDLQTHNGVLWIRGNPGAGKSTLLKQTYTLSKQDRSSRIILSYFFNARGQLLEKSPLGMYRSLVFQLIDQAPAALERFVTKFIVKERKHGRLRTKNDSSGSVWAWDAAELRDFLLSEVKALSSPLIVFIDALDECRDAEGNPQPKEVVSFLEVWSIMASESQKDMKICLSSRHYPHIHMRSFVDFNLDRRKEHTQDIQIYVHDKLVCNDMDIKEALLEKSQGIFMWVALVTAILNDAFFEGNIEAMRAKLETIPKDLDALFWEILGKKSDDAKDTVLMFQLVLFSMDTLEPHQLYCAVKTGIGPCYAELSDHIKMKDHDLQRYVKNCSKGLIEIRGTSPGHLMVQFIHESVRDFLLRNQRLRDLDPSLGHHFVGTSYDRLSDLCLSHLEAHVKGCLTCSCFMEHSVQNMFLYAGEAHQRGVSQKQRFGLLLHEYPSALRLCRKSLDHSYYLSDAEGEEEDEEEDEDKDEPQDEVEELEGQRDDTTTILLYNICSLKRCEEDLCNLLLSELNVHIDGIGGLHGTSLQAAVSHKHLDLARLLISNGANVNVQGGECGTALQAAAGAGVLNIVEVLLDAGAHVNILGGSSNTALEAAAEGENVDIVKLLIRKGADINIQGGDYGNALAAAIQSVAPSSEEIVKVLLEAGADFDLPSSGYPTALDAALNLSNGNYIEFVDDDHNRESDNHFQYLKEEKVAILRRFGATQCNAITVSEGAESDGNTENGQHSSLYVST